jgi:transposase
MLSRTFLLKLAPNKAKLDTARYTYEKHLLYVQHWTTQLYFKPDFKEGLITSRKGLSDEEKAVLNKKAQAFSTEGTGMLCNQAQQRARAILSAHWASTEATGNKSNVPQVKQIGCPARLEASKTKEFDYWLSVENAMEKRGRVMLPCHSHIRLNHFLKTGWTLNMETAELYYRSGVPYARVFVQKEVAKPVLSEDTLGCDVGYRNGVARSDGYIGQNTAKVIKAQRNKEKAQKRQDSLADQPRIKQLHKEHIQFTGKPPARHYKGRRTKTVVKQILDIEARRAIARCKPTGKTLCVESPKVLNNLRSGSLQGWARNYFAARCHVIGAEEGVAVWEVNPAYTSQTCNGCGKTDAQSRSGASFICTACGHMAHADVNAGKNIASKGGRSLREVLRKRRAA